MNSILVAQVNYLEISFWHVATAALLILINKAVSVALKLKLEKTLLEETQRDGKHKGDAAQ